MTIHAPRIVASLAERAAEDTRNVARHLNTKDEGCEWFRDCLTRIALASSLFGLDGSLTLGEREAEFRRIAAENR